MRRHLVVATVLLCSCASGFRDLREKASPGEWDAFTACRSFLASRACPPRGDALDTAVHQDICMGDMAGQLAELPAGAPRRAFLVQAGCPETLVDAKLGAAGATR